MKKLLYIDMDGVIADFEKALYDRYPHIKEHRGTEGHPAMVDAACMEYNRIFHELEPMEFAVEAVHMLCDYYEVYLLSTPMWCVPESFTDKRLWVERVLGDKLEKRLILSHHKGLCRGEYLIDDRIKHGVDEFQGEHIHFAQLGFENWAKVIEYLAKKDDFWIIIEDYIAPDKIERWFELLKA